MTLRVPRTTGRSRVLRVPRTTGRSRLLRIPRTTSRPRALRGFTLIELLVALMLMALLSAVLFGSLKMAGKSADSGDARAEASASMRLASQFLHTQLEEQHPQRMKKMPDFPLLFSGSADEVDYAAALPARVQGGGVWYYRLHVAQNGDRSLLVLDRMIPDVTAATMPAFGVADQGQSVLAEGVQAIKLQYYGRDAGANVSQDPTWRTSWDDRQNLPLAIRIDVTTTQGSAWPSIFASPRTAPESGCRSYDAARMRCVNA